MEKSIFEKAKFGDKFVNRVGKIFIFQKIDSNNYATLFSENSVWSCPLDGKNGEVENEFDIIGKYKDTIDEYKLDELALTEYGEEWAIGLDKDEYSLSHETKLQIKAFKEGYRKAMKE